MKKFVCITRVMLMMVALLLVGVSSVAAPTTVTEGGVTTVTSDNTKTTLVFDGTTATFTFGSAITKDDALAFAKALYQKSGIDVVIKSDATNYALQESDFQYLFGKDKNSSGLSNQNNFDDNSSSILSGNATNGVKSLNFSDAYINSFNYGEYLFKQGALKTLVCSKIAAGPNMTNGDAKNTPIKKSLETMIIPRRGTDGVGGATVGIFQNFAALKTVDINSCAKGDIPQNAFKGCYSLESVKFLSAELGAIGESAFEGCTKLTRVSMEFGVTSIGNKAFSGCDIQYLSISDKVTTIGTEAFKDNKNLTSVTIPANVTQIEQGAFKGMTYLTDVYVLGENTKAKQDAFERDLISNGMKNSNGTDKDVVVRGDWANFKGQNPAYFHFPNTETARKNYLSPFIQLLSDSEFLYGLEGEENQNSVASKCKTYFDNYKREGKDLNQFVDNARSNVFTPWLNSLKNTYPNVDWDQKQNTFWDYVKQRYLVDLQQGSVQLDENGVEKWKTLRPWVVDEDGYCYPRESVGKEFSGDQGGDYAGWRQFILTAPNLEKTIPHYDDKRILDDRWYSVCYPFSLNWAEISYAFGSEAQVCQFRKVEKRELEDGSFETTFYFDQNIAVRYDADKNKMGVIENETVQQQQDGMLAGVPYMILPKTKYVEEGVRPVRQVISEELKLHKLKELVTQGESGYSALKNVYADYVEVDKDGKETKSVKRAFKFHGDYGKYNDETGELEADKNLPQNCYYWGYKEEGSVVTKGFYHLNNTGDWARWTPTCAVVEAVGTGLSLSKLNTIFDFAEDGDPKTTTRIVVMPKTEVRPAAVQRVYNLQGQVVREGSTSLEGLSQGIYIVNGKKFVVR